MPRIVRHNTHCLILTFLFVVVDANKTIQSHKESGLEFQCSFAFLSPEGSSQQRFLLGLNANSNGEQLKVLEFSVLSEMCLEVQFDAMLAIFGGKWIVVSHKLITHIVTDAK